MYHSGMADSDSPDLNYEIAVLQRSPVQLGAPNRTRVAIDRWRNAELPSSDALNLAQTMAKRVHRSAQIRRGFTRRTEQSAPPPPLSNILRSGRGSDVRLKLYLTMVWIAAQPPHSIRGTASAWATLLDLDDPSGKGARQIRSSIRWLGKHQYVSDEGTPGVGMKVTLLSDLGTGDAYSVPGAAITRAKEADEEPNPIDFYDNLPSGFWTRGWIHVLSGPAIAMLLVMLDVQRGRSEQDLWLSESVAQERYTLSEETRSKGLAELEAFELVTSAERRFRSNAMEAMRRRKVYRLYFDRLVGPIPLPGIDRPEADS